MARYLSPALFLFCLALTAALSSSVASQATAQDEKAVATEIIQQAEADPTAVRYGDAIATRYKVGAKVVAKGGTVRDIRIMVAVPLECPEQEVHVVEEDFSPHVASVEFRNLPDDKRAPPGARQMLITIAELPPRQEAQAIITYEVVTKTMLPPEETATLKIPAKPDRTLKPYLSASPFINVNHRKIRDAVKEALAAKKDDAATSGSESADAKPAGDQKSDAEASSGYEDVTAAAESPVTAAPVQPEERAGSSPTPAPAEESAGGLVGVDSSASFETNAPAEPPATSDSASTSTAEP